MLSDYKEPVTEPCEMCGVSVTYGFSLCHDCGEEVKDFNEVTGNYHMNNGEIIDTTKHQW